MGVCKILVSPIQHWHPSHEAIRSEWVFWQMGHDRVVKTLAKTVGAKGVSKGIPTSWSNSLIISIYPAAIA